jgi:hypothetical protein
MASSPEWLLPFQVLYAFSVFPMKAACPTHVILLEIIILTTLYEEQK